jgi:hypothetical protein
VEFVKRAGPLAKEVWLPSQALKSLGRRLRDLDQLEAAHMAVGKGKKWARGTAAINRAAVVLLCAHLEGFVEDLFSEGLKVLYPRLSPKKLVDQFRNPWCAQVDDLFGFLGIEEITKLVSFTPLSNQKVRAGIDGLVRSRNKIAHGALTSAYVADVRSWRGYVTQFAGRLDSIVSRRLKEQLGSAPW